MKFSSKGLLPLALAALLMGGLYGCDQAGDGEHEHWAEAWKTVTPATCTAEGTATGTCGDCGEEMTRKLDKLPHSYTESHVEPTCTEAGGTRFTCACGYAYDGAAIPPTGHHYRKTVTQPTCDKEGFARYTCDCGFSYVGNQVAATGHTFTETVTAPTCEAPGFTRFTCTCGYTYDGAYVPATGHTFTESVTAPTCEAPGFTRFTCTCGYTYDGAYVAATGHTFTETVTAPTCEEVGFTRFACATCDYTYDGAYVTATGHTFTETVTPPTCEGEGFTHFDCDACDYAYDGVYVVPTGHTLVETVHAPTCVDDGYTHFDCEICDYEYDGYFIPAMGEEHVNMTSLTVYPTVNRPEGYVQFDCPDCGHSYRETMLYTDIITGAYVDTTEIFRQGIDTSKWNHVGYQPDGELNPLDWEALKAAGVEFVILKAGSTNGIDATFERDYLDAKAAGLEVGAYFYAYSTTVEDTLADAEMLLSWLEGKQFELPIYYDMEDPSMQDLGEETLMALCKTFMERLQEEGYYAALYVNANWLYALMDTEWIKANLDVWYARYTADDYSSSENHFTLADREIPWVDGYPSMPGEENKRYGIWQYTQIGQIDGFTVNFDFNFAFKDYKPIMEQWGLNGFPRVPSDGVQDVVVV